MTIPDNVIAYLRTPYAYCDECISQKLGTRASFSIHTDTS
jgi:hypothetical protein